MTDLEVFELETEDFVEMAVPDASKEKRQEAVAAVLRAFEFLFDKDGKRIALGQ